MNRSLAVVAILMAAQLPAQTVFHVAYPQDATTGTSGNNIAFGISGSNSGLDEGRYQMLIPATHLPGVGSAILGFEVLPHALPIAPSHSLTFQSLTVTLSHDIRTSLDPMTANNLPNPAVVLSGQNLTLTYTRRQWSRIMFTTPFLYDGQSDLVLDVQKVFDRNVNTVPTGGSSMQTTGNPGRPDLPDARWEFGALGSGVATATATRFYGGPLFLRVLVGAMPTLTLRGDADGIGGSFFALGRTMDVNLNARAGSTFGTFVSVAFQSPVQFPPLLGSLRLAGPQTARIGIVGPGDVDTMTLAIPTNQSLVGLHLVWQGAVVTAGGPPLWTCASDLFLNS